MCEVTAEWVMRRLRYDAETGRFLWIGGKRGVVDGEVAGTPNEEGYIIIRCEGRRFKAHRLAWLVSYGEFPRRAIDHRNGKKGDNRIRNLRECTASQNKQNVVVARSDSRSGRRGVVLLPSGKFRATIKPAIGGNRHLGVFATAEEASAAYMAAKSELHPFAEIAA